MQYDMAELMRLAQSPAGQQLITLLQKNGGTNLKTAVEKATGGDYNHAKQVLSSLLSSPEARELLKQLEDSQ